MSQSWIWPCESPDNKREDGDSYYSRDKICRHNVGQLLYRRPAALGISNHLHYLGQQGIGPDFFCSDDDRSGTVDRRSYHFITG